VNLYSKQINVGYKSGGQMGSFDEKKNRGVKFRASILYLLHHTYIQYVAHPYYIVTIDMITDDSKMGVNLRV
jgi:hypothetical protein